MSKAILVIFLAFGIISIGAQLTPAQQTLQSFLNGVYQENGLSDPTTIVECFDPTTAQNTVSFIGQILPKFASASMTDLPSLLKQVEAFGKTIPQPENDQQLEPLENKYGINNNTNWAALEAKTINSQWQSQQYQQAGNTLAAFAHQLIGLSSTFQKLGQLTPAQTTLQQAFNGIFMENHLSNPTTVVQCFDPTSAQQTVQFIGQILPQAASGSISDLTNIVKECEQFANTLPSSVGDCLSTNSEIAQLENAYGINANTNWAKLEAQIVSYITFHFSAVHKSLQGINSQWQSLNYYNAGWQLAQLAHQLIGQSNLKLEQNSPAQQTIQLVLNGLFEQNKLPDPTTIVPCIDPNTAQLIVNFIGQILPEAASGSISNLISIIKQVQAFGDQIPASVSDCLKDNAEFEALGNAYGINNNTSEAAIIAKVTSYITFHYPALHKALGNINNLWSQQQYYNVGFQAAVLGHAVLGDDSTPLKKLKQNSPAQQTLQLVLNGLFEQNKLPDPTTILPCIDPNTAQLIVNFIGQILPEAAKGSISSLISIIKQVQGFGDQIPDSVKTCLKDNAEFVALGNAYGINNNTSQAAIIAKVTSYITFHYPALHKALGNINNLWSQQQYYQVGYQAAVLGHAVLGDDNSIPELTQSNPDAVLQQGLNGLFEENKLVDPTTIVPCFTGSTAQQTVDFLTQVLAEAAKGSISDLVNIVKQVQAFGDSLPQDVQDCLDNNSEFNSLGNAYGITPDTDPNVIISKIVSYVTFHYPALHKTLGNINTQWVSSNYYQAGFQGGALGHQILG